MLLNSLRGHNAVFLGNLSKLRFLQNVAFSLGIVPLGILVLGTNFCSLRLLPFFIFGLGALYRQNVTVVFK